MRSKEECSWCMSTQHIVREISPQMPEEFKLRCSACHEMFWEEHRECDNCEQLIDTENDQFGYDPDHHRYFCAKCSV